MVKAGDQMILMIMLMIWIFLMCKKVGFAPWSEWNLMQFHSYLWLVLQLSKCGFHQPLKDKELEDLSHKNLALDAMKKVKWVVDMFRNWRNYCHSNAFDFIQCNLDDKSSITQDNLIFALVRFLTEVKKVDGSEFPGKTLYDILICLQFHLETMDFEWKLLDEAMLRDVRITLDNLMKLHTAQGLGTSVKQAQFLESFVGLRSTWYIKLQSTIEHIGLYDWERICITCRQGTS